MRHSVLVVKLLGEEGQFPQHGVHLLPLESRVLKSNGGLAEERTGAAIVAAREGEFPLGRPGGGAMARRRELGKALLRLRERLLGLVETSLLEQGAAEDELGVADLVEVVQEPADVDGIVDRLVELLRALRMLARAWPVAVPLGDERGLEVGVGDSLVVAHRLGELERTLDVLARGLPVAVTAIAARAPLEDVRAEAVAALARVVDELERGREVLQRAVDVRELVVAAPEPVQDLRPVDVAEGVAGCDRAGPLEPVERRAQLAEVHARPALREERAQVELGRARRPREARGRVDRVAVALLAHRLLGPDDDRLVLAMVAIGDAFDE